MYTNKRLKEGGEEEDNPKKRLKKEREEDKKSSLWRDLPEQLYTLVCSYCSVESIMSCYATHQSLHDIISSPEFVHHYSELQIQRRSYWDNSFETSEILKVGPIIVSHHVSTVSMNFHGFRHSIVTDDGAGDGISKTLSFKGSHVFKVVCDCKGVFFMLECSWNNPEMIFSDQTITICNPSIRRRIILPDSDYEENGVYRYLKILLGFGIDLQGSYKVLKLAYQQDSSPSCVVDSAELYDLREGCWRSLQVELPSFEFEGQYSHFHDYSMHWLCYAKESEERECDRYLFSFNCMTSTVSITRLPQMEHPRPEVSKANEAETSYLMESHGRLAMAQVKHHKSVISGTFHEMTCTVWVAEKYDDEQSWKVWYFLDLDKAFVSRPIYLMGKGQFLFHQNQCLSSYNAVNSQMRHLTSIYHDYHKEPQLRVFRYVDTLRLLEEGTVDKSMEHYTIHE